MGSCWGHNLGTCAGKYDSREIGVTTGKSVPTAHTTPGVRPEWVWERVGSREVGLKSLATRPGLTPRNSSVLSPISLLYELCTTAHTNHLQSSSRTSPELLQSGEADPSVVPLRSTRDYFVPLRYTQQCHQPSLPVSPGSNLHSTPLHYAPFDRVSPGSNLPILHHTTLRSIGSHHTHKTLGYR